MLQVGEVGYIVVVGLDHAGSLSKLAPAADTGYVVWVVHRVVMETGSCARAELAVKFLVGGLDFVAVVELVHDATFPDNS